MSKRLIDLSHVISDGLVTYPGLPAPSIGVHMSREESESHYAAGTRFHIGRIAMVANTGTYIDAPFHRFEGQPDIAGLPLESLADLPGACIAVSGRRRIGPGDLERMELAGKAVLLCTGWSRHWGTPQYGENHPFLSSEAATLLVERGARLVGIDSLNIDDTEDGLRPAHTRLLEAGIPIVEHLRGLGELVDKSFRFFAVPGPVQGLGSFPVRAFAIVSATPGSKAH